MYVVVARTHTVRNSTSGSSTSHLAVPICRVPSELTYMECSWPFRGKTWEKTRHHRLQIWDRHGPAPSTQHPATSPKTRAMSALFTTWNPSIDTVCHFFGDLDRWCSASSEGIGFGSAVPRLLSSSWRGWFADEVSEWWRREDSFWSARYLTQKGDRWGKHFEHWGPFAFSYEVSILLLLLLNTYVLLLLYYSIHIGTV